MIIVSGKLYVPAEQRNAFLARSREAMLAARGAPGCLDFIVAANPIELDRVNVYDEWQSRHSSRRSVARPRACVVDREGGSFLPSHRVF